MNVIDNIERNDAEPQPSVAGGLIVLLFVLIIMIGEAAALVYAVSHVLPEYGFLAATGVVALLMLIFGLIFN